MCRKNEYNLLMGAIGSDQSRHGGDFAKKKHHFDDFVKKKWSFGRLFDENMKISPSVYRCGNLFVDYAATIHRCCQL